MLSVSLSMKIYVLSLSVYIVSFLLLSADDMNLRFMVSPIFYLQDFFKIDCLAA